MQRQARNKQQRNQDLVGAEQSASTKSWVLLRLGKGVQRHLLLEACSTARRFRLSRHVGGSSWLPLFLLDWYTQQETSASNFFASCLLDFFNASTRFLALTSPLRTEELNVSVRNYSNQSNDSQDPCESNHLLAPRNSWHCVSMNNNSVLGVWANRCAFNEH